MNREIKFRIDNNEKYVIDDAGFLRCDAAVTRAGIFEYYEDGKIIKELRPREEVFKDDSLRTLKSIPITQRHPKGLVTIKNVKHTLVGTTGENVRIDKDFVSVPIVLYDNDVITNVIENHKKGKDTELSCGYTAKIDRSSGSNEFGFYDTVQSDIKYNHVSIVEKGRAGHNVKLKLDNKEDKIVKFVKSAIKTDSFTMDEIDVELDEKSIPTANKLSKKLDEAVDVIVSLDKDKVENKKKLDELQAKFDQAKEEIEKYKKDVAELSDVNSDRVKKLIKAKADLYEVAKTLKVKTDDKEDKDIKLEIIKSVFPKFDETGKSEDYINSRFDGAIETIKANEEDSNNKKLGELRVESKKDSLSPREKFMQESRDAWKAAIKNN